MNVVDYWPFTPQEQKELEKISKRMLKTVKKMMKTTEKILKQPREDK